MKAKRFDKKFESDNEKWRDMVPNSHYNFLCYNVSETNLKIKRKENHASIQLLRITKKMQG